MDIFELQQRLDVIRAWRKLELSHARSVAERHRDSAEQSYLCRSWTLMIYAHCDQSLKLISKEYLIYLKSIPRNDYDYRTVWLTFFGKEAIKGASDSRFSLFRSSDAESKNTMLNNIDGKEVFASGNFSYPLLRFFTEWILQTQFDHAQYRAFCTTLKEKRDGIAHGEEVRVQTVEDCIAWHDPALSLLDSLVDTTVNTALTH